MKIDEEAEMLKKRIAIYQACETLINIHKGTNNTALLNRLFQIRDTVKDDAKFKAMLKEIEGK